MMKRYIVMACLLLSSCGFESDDSNNIPAEGLYLEWQVNLHQDHEDAVTVVSMYQDGVPALLEGGDVMLISQGDKAIRLKKSASYKGAYTAELEDAQVAQTVDLNIEYRPVLAREDRWYPAELAYVDAGPTQFNGLSAKVTFPEKVTIQSPLVINGDAVTFSSITQTVNLKWAEVGMGSDVQIRLAVSCDNTVAVQTYGRSFEFEADDGDTSIALSDVIYDLEADFPRWLEADNAIRGILQQELNRISANGADPLFFAKRAPVNPLTSNCDIELFIFRLKSGALDDAFDQGRVYGSRSAAISLQYRPDTVVVPGNE